jgi:chromosome segregation ATPase
LKAAEYVQIAPRDREIASLKEQLNKLETARDPDRKQINELLAANKKLENDLAVAQDNLKQSRDDNTTLQKRINGYVANGSIFSKIDALDKRKSEIEKEVSKHIPWGIALRDDTPPKPRTVSQHEEQRQRQINELQSRIRDLYPLLSRELVGPIANSGVGCAPWHRHAFSDTNESTTFH